MNFPKPVAFAFQVLNPFTLFPLCSERYYKDLPIIIPIAMLKIMTILGVVAATSKLTEQVAPHSGRLQTQMQNIRKITAIGVKAAALGVLANTVAFCVAGVIIGVGGAILLPFGLMRDAYSRFANT